MFHPKIIFRIIGMLLYVEAFFLLGSVAVALYYDEHIIRSLLMSVAAMVGTGSLLTYLCYGTDRNISRKDGYIVVTLCWIIFSLFGSLPYMLSGYIPSFTDAFFETMSGFTTTGATILQNIEALPKSLLFWRMMTHWVGGLGIVFFTVAVFPIFGLGDINLFAAESVGPMRAKLHPRISVTARWILTIYIGLTIVTSFSLYFAGMGWFDSICHAMSIVATGGFSTKQDSIAAFGSPQIEYVTSLFMFLSGINMSLLYLFIFKLRPKELLRDTEFRTYTSIVAVFTLFIAAGLFLTNEGDAETSFRNALFQVISIQTTTGFASVNYIQWMPLLWLALLALMFIGACSGSTSGAMKCVRISILFKVVANEFKRIVHPNAVIPVRMARKVVPITVQSAILAYTVIYMIVIIVGLVVNMGFGLDFLDAIGLSISSVGNVGPALGNYGPIDSFAPLPGAVKWFCAFQMLVGRLEFFAVLLLLTPVFWKRK
ncbi:MAG: TrkH family potassium uptake protein [Bacteroidaceae bacterium]|nr:TrkH family potassium uptake protein [Bacteroidaceae bacterium]